MRGHLLAGVLVASACGGEPARDPIKPPYPRGLIILGIDGMDPKITSDLLARGELPHLAALIERGGWSELDTTSPPQSPVAWSTFITGELSDGHGIYDFVHRDAHELSPYLSTSKVTPPEHSIEIGSLALSFGSPDVSLLRGGTAFWELLERHGVPATVVKVPANFPPPTTRVAESMSGMGTPDLMGTYGTYQLVSNAPDAHHGSGGLVHRISFGTGDRASTSITGPADPLSADGDAMQLPVEIVRDPDVGAALIRIGDREVILTAGEWSRWEPISFDPGLLAGEVSGMVRLYLRGVEPFHLYISPINLDPLAPAMPLSSPPDYATELAHDIGRYYTQGMPEDTKAYSSGALDAPEFLSIVDRVMTETEDAMQRELSRFRGGLLFVYLSSIDQASHVFFRSLDPDAPPEERAHADVIPALYRRVDRWIGQISAGLDPSTRLVVMSDHGFAPYRTKVHLNTFLARRGYLVVLPADRRQPGPLGHIDWTRTQAYALGLNQVFVNVRGREGHGTVAPEERAVVAARLERDLLTLRDPDSGVSAVTRVDRPLPGDFPGRAPDLIVGYRRGYRSSDESALGAVGDVVFEPNRDRWSGDHCMDPSAVPGVFISDQPISKGARPGLIDLAPTILHYFQISSPPELAGRPLLPEEPT